MFVFIVWHNTYSAGTSESSPIRATRMYDIKYATEEYLNMKEDREKEFLRFKEAGYLSMSSYKIGID